MNYFVINRFFIKKNNKFYPFSKYEVFFMYSFLEGGGGVGWPFTISRESSKEKVTFRRPPPHTTHSRPDVGIFEGNCSNSICFKEAGMIVYNKLSIFFSFAKRITHCENTACVLSLNMFNMHVD